MGGERDFAEGKGSSFLCSNRATMWHTGVPLWPPLPDGTVAYYIATMDTRALGRSQCVGSMQWNAVEQWSARLARPSGGIGGGTGGGIDIRHLVPHNQVTRLPPNRNGSPLASSLFPPSSRPSPVFRV